MTSNLDRSEISRALAKAIAYKQCGKHAKAAAWAMRLIDLLGSTSIIDRDFRVCATHLLSNEAEG